MFVLKKNIKGLIDSVRKSGFQSGLDHARVLHENEIERQRSRHETEILKLHSSIEMLEKRIEKIISRERAAIEKDRMANKKVLYAQNIVLKVQQILESISESSARGYADITGVREKIEGKVKNILE